MTETAGYACRENTCLAKALLDLKNITNSGPSGLVECNRLALAKKVRRSDLWTSMIFPATMGHLANQRGDNRPIITTSPLRVASWGLERGGLAVGPPFRYEPHDPHPVQMLLWTRDSCRYIARKNCTPFFYL